LNEGKLDAWFEHPDGTMAENEHSGYMNIDDVQLPEDAEYYLCGPLAFMKLVRSALIARGIPAKDIQYEVFGPDLWLADFQ
ncbi:hemin transporter, partial [Glutamicibacter ardleyensis]